MNVAQGALDLTMKQNTDKISIQVGLSGFSFKIETDTEKYVSEWMSSDKVFAIPEFQKRYADVNISVFTPKFTLVPLQFYDSSVAEDLLKETVDVNDDDLVQTLQIPDLSSVLIYSDTITSTLSKVISETVLTVDGIKAKPLPEIYNMLQKLSVLNEYNKIIASYMDGVLYLVVAQGNTLMLCNSFVAPDFTTAEYFIFMVLKKLQLNPEISTISFCTPLYTEEEMSLYRYFNNVDHI